MPKKGANARAKAKVPPQNTAPAPVAAPSVQPAPPAPAPLPLTTPASNVAIRKPEPKKKADIPAPIPIPPKNGLPGGFPSSSPIAEFEQDPFARFTSNEPWPGFSPPNSSSTSSSAGPTPEAEWSEFTAMLNQSSLSSSSSAMPLSSSIHNKATDEAHSPYSWSTKNLPFPAHESASAADQEWGATMPSALGSFMNAFTGQQRPPPPPEKNNNHTNKKKAAALAPDTSLSSSLLNAATKTFKGGWGKQHHNNDNSAATSPDSATPTAADPKLSFATQMTNGNPFKNGWFNEEEFGNTPATAVPPALDQFSAPKTAVKGGWGVKPAWGPSKNNNGSNITMDHVDDESPLWGGAAKASSAIVAAPAAATATTTTKGGWTTKSTVKAADHDAWLTSGSPVPTSSLLERGRHHTKSHGNAHTMNTKSPANAYLTNSSATAVSSRRGRGAGTAITREPSRADRVRSEWSSFSLWHESELRTFESAKRAFVKEHDSQVSRRLMAHPPPKHGAIRAQLAEELQGKLREREEDFVERLRGEWENRLVRAGLDVEDWTDMTEAEMSDVSVKLGGGAGSGSSASSASEEEDDDDDDGDDDDDDDEDENGPTASMEEPEKLLQSSSPLAAFVQRQQKLHGYPLPAEPSMVKDKKSKGSALPQFDANMLNMSGDEMARPLSHMLAQAAHAPWELGDRSETPRPHTFNRTHAHSSRHPLASDANQDSIAAPHQQQPTTTTTTSSSSHAAHAATSNPHHSHHSHHHHHPSSHAHTSSSSTTTTTTKPSTAHISTTTASSYIGPELYDTSPPSTPPSLEEEEAAFKEFKLEVRLQKIREFHTQACELELALAKHLSSLVVRRGGDSAMDTDAPRKLVAEHKREMEALRATKEEERKAVVEAERERRRMSIRGRDAQFGASNNNKTQHRESSVVHGGKDLRKQIHAAQLAGQAPVLASPGAVGGPGGRHRTGSNASLSNVPAFLRKTTAENVNSNANNNNNNNNTSSDEEQQQSEFEVWHPSAAPTLPPQAPVPPAARPESRARAPERAPAPTPVHANTTTTTKKGKKKAAVTVEEVADEDDELPSAIRQLQASAPAVRDNTPSLVPGRSNTPILQEIDASFLASPLPSSASMMMRNLPAVQAHDIPSPFQHQQQQPQWQSSPSPFQSSSSPSPFSVPPPTSSSKVRRPSLLSSSRVASSTTTSTLASSAFGSSASGKKSSPPPAPVAAEASFSLNMHGSTGREEEDDEESSDEESNKEGTRNDAAIAAIATATATGADDDDEPDEIFKMKLRAQIESSMQAEVRKAQAAHDESMRKATTSGQRRTLETQHKDFMRQFKTAAQMQYEAALERERAERKLFTGQDVGSGLTEAYVREQQSILEQVRRDRERDSSSSPSTSSSSSSASPPLAASLSSPSLAAVPASLPTPASAPASATSAPSLLSTTTSSSSVAVPIAARPGSRMSRASFSSHSHASVSASMSRTHLPLSFGAGSESESEFDEPMLSSSVSSEQGGFGKHARWTPSAVPDSDTESVIDDTDAFLLHEQSGGDRSSSADTLAQMAAWAFQKEVGSGGGGTSMMTMDKYHNHNQQKQKHQAPPSTRTKHAHLLSSSSLSSPAPRSLATPPPPPPMSSSARPKNRRRGSFVGSQAGDGSLESWEIALKEVLHTGSSKSNY